MGWESVDWGRGCGACGECVGPEGGENSCDGGVSGLVEVGESSCGYCGGVGYWRGVRVGVVKAANWRECSCGECSEKAAHQAAAREGSWVVEGNWCSFRTKKILVEERDVLAVHSPLGNGGTVGVAGGTVAFAVAVVAVVVSLRSQTFARVGFHSGLLAR